MQKIDEGKDEKGAFRMVNLADLLSLRMDGKSYNWDNVAQTFIEA
jgi:hypothetical protein